MCCGKCVRIIRNYLASRRQRCAQLPQRPHAPTSAFCGSRAQETGEAWGGLRFAVAVAVGVGVAVAVRPASVQDDAATTAKYEVRSTGFADGDGEHECDMDLTLDCEEPLLPWPGRDGRMASMEGFRVRPVMSVAVGRRVQGSCAVPEMP